MIVQDLDGRIRCVSQHDHAILSGIFARYWHDRTRQEEASTALIVATSLHDMCWIDADHHPRFDPHSGRPFDFLGYPENAKLELYVRGIQAMERIQAYGALLHALHFSVFASVETHPDFHAKLSSIIERSTERCHREGHSLEHVNRDLDLLRVFDVFSLLICMTGHEIERTPPPWLNPSPWLTRRGMEAHWEGDDFVVEPFHFREPFTVPLIYREVETREDGSVDPQKLMTAEIRTREIRVRPRL